MDKAESQGPTLDEILSAQWLSRAQRHLFEAVSNCTRNGVRIGGMPYHLRSKSRHETRLLQKNSELLLAAHALVTINLRGFDLADSERPDFILNGSVGLEVAELVDPDSARTSNATENVRTAVRDLLDNDENLKSALGDRYISINTWETPRRSQEEALVAECCRTIALGNPARMNGNMVVDPAFPVMKAHRAHIYRGQHEGGYFDFTTPPGSFSPLAMTEVAPLFRAADSPFLSDNAAS